MYLRVDLDQLIVDVVADEPPVLVRSNPENSGLFIFCISGGPEEDALLLPRVAGGSTRDARQQRLGML